MFSCIWIHDFTICICSTYVYFASTFTIVAYAMWVCQGHWNHKVTAGLPVSDYGESDWNLGFPWQCCWGHHVWVSCVNSVTRVRFVGLCRLYAISTLYASNQQWTKPVLNAMPTRYVYAEFMNMLMVICDILTIMFTCTFIQYYMQIVCIFVLLFLFACSDVIHGNVCLMWHFTFQRRVGGNCSFPILWCVFRSRPTHPSFPTLNGGEMSSVMMAVNECKDDAKQAVWNATMQCRWDVMQHPFPRSISPLIAVAENKCRSASDSVVHMSVDCGFWKNSQINYLTRHVFVYECMSSLYVYAIHMITSRQRLRRRMCYVGLPRSLKS